MEKEAKETNQSQRP